MRNEAELESLFVVPLLTGLGVSTDDLKMQRILRFQAGRHQIVEDVSEALGEKRARLDILVTKGNRNAFVIEAKKPGAALTDEDALQAISYARLVHPIAPYALVTNGKETIVYHSVTRERIPSDEISLEGGFDIKIPDADDFDALACFLRLSTRNLLLFSRAQVDQTTLALRGSADNLSKKYIPEVHQRRAAVFGALEKFLLSPQTTLAIVADSGMGKTCTMCHEVLAALDAGRPALFFRGSELEQRLLDQIADEFRWTFLENITPQALVGRLTEIAADEKLLLFIDAIDEWREATAVQQLGSLARHLLNTNVKLVVSCKASTWPSLLEVHGAPTDFSNHIAQHGKELGFHIGAFDESELLRVWRKYKETYNFDGVWDPGLRNEAMRSPFFMRVAFEVARQKGLAELRESRTDIFEQYYAASLKKTSNVPLADRVLTVFANRLLEGNSDDLAIGELRALLRLRPTEELPEDLVEWGVLERSGLTGSERLRFAFEGLRNYVIAFKARRWHELSDEELEREYQGIIVGGVQEEAWLAFYRLADARQKRVLDKGLFEPAQRFLSAYKEIIATNFPAFGPAFPPGDPDRVGLVFEADLRQKVPYEYGVRLLQEGDPEILILPKTVTSRRWGNLPRYGAGGLANRIAPNLNWLDVDPFEELLRINFARLLPKALVRGELDEKAAPELARELLAAAVISKPGLLNEPNRGPGKEALPLSATRINYWLLLNQHWARLESEMTDRKITSGEIATQRAGEGFTYSVPPLSDHERTELRQHCDRLILLGQAMRGRGRHVPLDDVSDRLRSAVNALPSPDEIIMGPVFPEAAAFWRGGQREMGADFLQYAERFVGAFLCNYERLVVHNFPTLKRHFALYRALPGLVRIKILRERGLELRDQTLFIDIFSPEGPATSIRESAVEIVEFSERREWHAVHKEPIEVDGQALSWYRSYSVGAASLWGNSRRYPDLGFQPCYTVLRDFTYSWIERELPEVMEALGEMYGLRKLEISSF